MQLAAGKSPVNLSEEESIEEEEDQAEGSAAD